MSDMTITREINGVQISITLTDEEMDRLSSLYQWEKQTENNIRSMIDFLIWEESIPEIDRETVDTLVAVCMTDEVVQTTRDRYVLSNESDIRGVIRRHLHLLPVKAAYGLCNTASVNVYYADSDRVFSGINDEEPMWCDISDDSESFFLGGLEVPLGECMRV